MPAVLENIKGINGGKAGCSLIVSIHTLKFSHSLYIVYVILFRCAHSSPLESHSPKRSLHPSETIPAGSYKFLGIFKYLKEGIILSLTIARI